MIATVLEPTGIDFAELAARGTVGLAEPVIQFADFGSRRRAAVSKSRPSAREADGHPRCRSPTRTPTCRGRLRLLSPASPWLLNDSFANDAKLTRRIGAATVMMHPPTRPTADSPTGSGAA